MCTQCKFQKITGQNLSLFIWLSLVLGKGYIGTEVFHIRTDTVVCTVCAIGLEFILGLQELLCAQNKIFAATWESLCLGTIAIVKVDTLIRL